MIPDVVTTLKFGKFTLQILAYRKLTKAEKEASVSMYLQSRRSKTFPKEGSAKLITAFGMFDR